MTTLLWCAEDLPGPRDGVVDIAVLGCDVVVAHQHESRVAREFVAHPVPQALQPAHLVDELFAVGRLAVRKVGADDAHASHRACDHARLLVLQPRDVPHHFQRRLAADERHSVVGLLPEPLHLVPGRPHFSVRKLVVGKLGFLQHQHIHRVGLKPIQHLRQAHGERVDVPGGEFQSDPKLLFLSNFISLFLRGTPTHTKKYFATNPVDESSRSCCHHPASGRRLALLDIKAERHAAPS